MGRHNRLDRRKFLTVAGTTSAITMAGCIGGEDPSASDGPPEFAALAGKQLQYLDPHKVVDDLTKAVSLSLYSELLTVDENGNIAANVASDWSANEDGTRWEFTLREDIVSHAGNQITAEDVVYSADRWASLNTGYSSIWQGVYEPGNAEAVDEYTVAIDIEIPFGPFPATLPMFYIVDSTVVKENEADGEYGDHGDYGQEFLNQNVAGSGPYKLAQLNQGESVELEAHEDYWKGWNDDQFKNARVEMIGEGSTIQQQMMGGNGHMTDQYLSPEAYQAMDGGSDTKVVQETGNQLHQLYLNTQRAPLDDINVRRAFALAFDYETAQQEIMGGADPAAGPVPGPMPGHNDDLEPRQQDMDAAQAALEESNYTVDEINDIGIEITWFTILDMTRRLSLSLSESLSELGITETSIEGLTYVAWSDRVMSPESTPHVSNFNQSANFATAEDFLFNKYHPSNAQSTASVSWYNDEELTALLEDARETVDQEERFDKYKQAQEHAYEAHPSIFVANPSYRLGMHQNVTDWTYYNGVLGFPRQIYPLRWDA